MINGLSLHTNYPFTQSIISHNLSLHINHPFTQSREYVIQRMTNGLCEGMDLCEWDGLCESMDCVTCIHPFTQTREYVKQKIINGLCERMVCVTIPSHKPSLHTNRLSFSVLHIIWFVWGNVIHIIWFV